MVSLIIPCYNGEKFIDRCLDSVINQTDRNIELILVNDGSNDKTNEIIKRRCKELKDKLTRFVYIEQENQGVGAACNVAFKEVSGEYLTLLDADDVMLPDSIKKRREWLDANPLYGGVRTNGYYVSENNLNITNHLLEVNDYMKTKEDIFEELFWGTTYCWPGTYMIRMEILEVLYPDRNIFPSRYGQNLQFVMMTAYKSKFGFIDIPLMKYVLREESLSHFSHGDVIRREFEAMQGYREIREYLIDHFFVNTDKEKWRKQTEKLYAGCFLNIAVKYGNKDLAKLYYKKAENINALNLSLKLNYYKLMNPFKYYLLRILCKLRFIG